METVQLPPLPTNNEPTGYAGFWRRVAALCIDFVLLVLVLLVFSIFYKLVTGSAQQDETLKELLKRVAFVLFWGYLVFSHARYGASIGKKTLGIKVFTYEGHSIGFSEAFVRYAPFILIDGIGYLGQAVEHSAPSLLIIIGALRLIVPITTAIWIAAHPRKRGPHDLLAKTVVLRMR